ncbi:MAG: hypothetical protein FJ335_08360 [Sphingomonadales bacterium]|nr:hypothetical protein [Sphingomonadales bacterium]
MAVVSNSFGGLRLTGEDAAKFRRQVSFGRPGGQVRSSVQQRIAAARLLVRDGSVTISNSDD